MICEIIDKFKYKNYEINQSFYHQQESMLCSNISSYKMAMSIPDELYTNDYCLEYAFIVFSETDKPFENIKINVQANGHDISDYNRDCLYYNKVFPIECMESYDDETNNLLKDMSQGKVKQLFFVPFKYHRGDLAFQLNDIFTTAKFGMNYRIPIDYKYPKKITHLTFIIKGLDCEKVDFYIKFAPNINNVIKLNEPLSLYPKSDFTSRVFIGIPGYGRRMRSNIAKLGDCMSNIYIEMVKGAGRRIKNYYRIVSEFNIEISGTIIFEIPVDYIALYLKVMKNIILCEVSAKNNCYIVPINLKELVNIAYIPLSNLHKEVRLNLIWHSPIDIFYYKLQKQVELQITYPKYESFIKGISKDVLRLVMEYLDDTTFINLMQTCRFMYSLAPMNQIKKRYEKYKISKDDLTLTDAIYNVMYHWPIPEFKTFLNEFRTIKQYRENIVDSDSFQHLLNHKGPIEWIIIEINQYLKPNMLVNVEFTIDKKFEFNEILKEKLEKYDLDTIHVIKKDPNFLKMHDPNKNRYLFYTKSVIYKNINMHFREKITCDLNIYIAENNWLDLSPQTIATKDYPILLY